MRHYTREHVLKLAQFYVDEAQSCLDVAEGAGDSASVRRWSYVRSAADHANTLVCYALADPDEETTRRECVRSMRSLFDYWSDEELSAVSCPDDAETLRAAALRWRWGFDLLRSYLDGLDY